MPRPKNHKSFAQAVPSILQFAKVGKVESKTCYGIKWYQKTLLWYQVLLCLFPGVLWLWHFLYSVGPHPVSSLHVYTFVVSRAFMAGAASQAGDADSSRAPGLTSGLQGSMNVHRGALLLVPQWQCISSFVFYIWIWHNLLKIQNCLLFSYISWNWFHISWLATCCGNLPSVI